MVAVIAPTALAVIVALLRLHLPWNPCTRVSVVIVDPHMEPAMHKEQGHMVQNPVEARAGFLDRPVLAVLALSVFLICLLFAGVYLGFFAR
jgi:hypothetical protein